MSVKPPDSTYDPTGHLSMLGRLSERSGEERIRRGGAIVDDVDGILDIWVAISGVDRRRFAGHMYESSTTIATSFSASLTPSTPQAATRSGGQPINDNSRALTNENRAGCAGSPPTPLIMRTTRSLQEIY